jgi:hypothetical protein
VEASESLSGINDTLKRESGVSVFISMNPFELSLGNILVTGGEE